MDLPGADENLRALRLRFPGVEIVPISAAQSDGLAGLRDHLERWLFEENPAAAGEESGVRAPEVVACE
jgi:hypothetical protein